LALPSDIAAVQLQNQVNQILNVHARSSNSVITQIPKQASVITSQKQRPNSKMLNLDGNAGDSSDEEDEEDEDDDDMDDDIDDKDDEIEEEREDEGQDEVCYIFSKMH